MINQNSQSGFALIETAIAVLVLSVMLAGAGMLYTTSAQQQKIQTTLEHMEIIASALSDYAETTNRLPCPADPTENSGGGVVFGWERGVTEAAIKSDAVTIPIGSCPNNNEWDGIVPFQTLDLPYYVTLDGWGNHLTYAISPVFAQNNDPSAGTASDKVHAHCRTSAWIESDQNLLPPKARFCCAVNGDGAFPPATDLIIEDLDGNTISPGARNTTEYDDLDHRLTDANDIPMASNTSITAPAFVLVSHGRDGDGAYLLEGGRVPDSSAGATLEDENFDADRIFYDGPIITNTSSNTYFDDIVLWMTQDGLMAKNGVSSCQYP